MIIDEQQSAEQQKTQQQVQETQDQLRQELPLQEPNLMEIDQAFPIDSDDDSYISSGTSSYHSDNEGKPNLHEKEIPLNSEELKNPEDVVRMEEEFEESGTQTYSKFKTQNEIDPELIEKFAPPKPQLDELDEIVDFGTVENYFEDGPSAFIIVQPGNPQQIFDLDNIVALKSKETIGFIMDLVGHITKPLYSVRLFPKYLEQIKQTGLEIKAQLRGERVYLVAKCLKMINADLPVILRKKGCDASNIFDEEVPEKDQEFSDDDKEKEHKKAKKNRKKNKNLEEGEIEMPIKRKHHNDEKAKKRFNNGQTIPMYSTNIPLTQQQPPNYNMFQQQYQQHQMIPQQQAYYGMPYQTQQPGYYNQNPQMMMPQPYGYYQPPQQQYAQYQQPFPPCIDQMNYSQQPYPGTLTFPQPHELPPQQQQQQPQPHLHFQPPH